jgi:hypothetical protein
MNTEIYKPVRSLPTPKGTVTNFDWSCGGMRSSEDQYRTYELSVFQFWYVYRRKPKWFGQFDGDRYLGKLRWISRNADGKQWKCITRRGWVDKWRVQKGSEEESTKTAGELMLAYGYLQPWFFPEIHQQRKVTWYFLGVRCPQCGKTAAEVRREREKVSLELRWPQGDGPRMEYWDAQDLVRKEMVCGCGQGGSDVTEA